jgi:hypothetical protein
MLILQLVHLNLITLIICIEEYELLNFLLCSSLNPVVTSSLGPNILFNTFKYLGKDQTA